MFDICVYMFLVFLQNRRNKATSKEVDAGDAEKVHGDPLTEGSDILMQPTLVSLEFLFLGCLHLNVF